MYERFDEVDSNMFGQGDVMSTRNNYQYATVAKHCSRDNSITFSFLFPFDPNFVTNFPLSSNTRTLWFEVS